MGKPLQVFRGGEGDHEKGILVITDWMPDDVIAKVSRTADVMHDADTLSPFGIGKYTCSMSRLMRTMGSDADWIEPFARREALRVHHGIIGLDYGVYSRIETGGYHSLHADNANLDGTPNHTYNRMVSVGIFLGSVGIDWQGGVLDFPNQEYACNPTKGLLIAFPSGPIWRHEAKTVTSGVRESIWYWYK